MNGFVCMALKRFFLWFWDSPLMFVLVGAYLGWYFKPLLSSLSLPVLGVLVLLCILMLSFTRWLRVRL